MREQRAVLAVFLCLASAPAASALSMAWTVVGNPGNLANTEVSPNYGAVDHAFRIGTYEVTNTQYAEFLNAVAAADPHGLYDERMGDPSVYPFIPAQASYGGITRTGTAGSYVYTPIAGRDNMPVNWVSFYDTLRFANWLNNGQGIGDTETGAYTIVNDSTPIPERNPEATVFLPTVDEWHKSAFYDAANRRYFLFAAGTSEVIQCAGPTSALNSANCDARMGSREAGPNADDLTPVGSFPSSPSPYGTYDQAGNVAEWVDQVGDYYDDSNLVVGGDFENVPYANFFGARNYFHLWQTANWVGFRVASTIPEPTTGLLVAGGLLSFATYRRNRV